MAWQCSGMTNAELVDRLAAAGLAARPRVVEAMRTIDRGWFAPAGIAAPGTRPLAYEDRPLAIGHNATISAPHMHAHALSTLEPRLQPGMTVLDVGAGSGYLTACMAVLVGPRGKVIGIEHVPELAHAVEKALAHARSAVGSERMAPTVVVAADGRLGDPAHAPFDCIHVGAAAPSRPDALLAQLAPGGLLYTPEDVGAHGDQVIALYRKEPSGTLQRTELLGVRYVPLTDLADQLRPAWR